ncbi:MAG TPA: thermonuclease family protein [Amaricoccus sp.]|jgi:endonuclease YncB( thermonuclease family)|nr:thermonuclease family protein [Amaricoccus sp.]
MAGRTGRLRAAAALAALLAVLSAGSGRQEAGAGTAGFEVAASMVHGTAAVSDGDTLRIGTERIRLFGIDAPEARQTCDSGAKGEWACGAAATARLHALVADRRVTCVPRDRDRYGRMVATCRVDGLDLGERMVAEGLARAYTRFGDDYAATEHRAKTERIGLWHGPAAAPWEFRADRAPAAAAPPAPGCRVKGNVSTSGARVYHLPGGRFYERTRIDPRRGEAWFCDEASARAAGFRPSRD